MWLQNVDGKRQEDGRYARFTEEISAFIPKDRQFNDPVRTFAYGTDASFYRLNPKLVVKVSFARKFSPSAPAHTQHATGILLRTPKGAETMEALSVFFFDCAHDSAALSLA